MLELNGVRIECVSLSDQTGQYRFRLQHFFVLICHSVGMPIHAGLEAARVAHYNWSHGVPANVHRVTTTTGRNCYLAILQSPVLFDFYCMTHETEVLHLQNKPASTDTRRPFRSACIPASSFYAAVGGRNLSNDEVGVTVHLG